MGGSFSEGRGNYGIVISMNTPIKKNNPYKSSDMWIALSAYLFWGVLPIYWKQVKTVSSMEVLTHRILWSLVFLVGLLAIRREFKGFIRDIVLTFRDKKRLLLLLGAACLLNVNWLVYIWAVNHNFILHASLGYYINPILSVILGQLVLRERLNCMQWSAFGLVILSVLWLVWRTGTIPWVSLVLAVSFALYGLIKKMTPLSPINSLSLETFVSSFPALGYWVWLLCQQQSAFIGSWNLIHLYLLGAGVVTAAPLILFNIGAKRLPLYIIGLFQYITPTMALLLGVFLYKESFSTAQLSAFILIWTGLILFFGFTYRKSSDQSV